MATKKKSKKKGSSKGTASPTAKPAAKAKADAGEGPEKPSRENIKFFIGQLILAGHVKAIPEAAPDQVQEAQRLRQFAERLCNQLRKFS